MSNILHCVNVSKKYKDKLILKDVNLELKEGEIVCLVGNNGSGKSTLINILSSTLSYDSGEIFYKNKNIKNNLSEYREDISVVFQKVSVIDELSGYENIKFWNKNVEENYLKIITNIINLSEEQLKEKVKNYSLGMKRRLDILIALLKKPKILLMDEPFAGVDKVARESILRGINELNNRYHMSILYSTHYIEEISNVANRVYKIENGKILSD